MTPETPTADITRHCLLVSLLASLRKAISNFQFKTLTPLSKQCDASQTFCNSQKFTNPYATRFRCCQYVHSANCSIVWLSFMRFDGLLFRSDHFLESAWIVEFVYLSVEFERELSTENSPSVCKVNRFYKVYVVSKFEIQTWAQYWPKFWLEIIWNKRSLIGVVTKGFFIISQLKSAFNPIFISQDQCSQVGKNFEEHKDSRFFSIEELNFRKFTSRVRFYSITFHIISVSKSRMPRHSLNRIT